MKSFPQVLSLILVLLICSVPLSGQEIEQDDEVIRVNADLTNLLFTATDKKNRFVTTLRPQDVKLFEDNVPQTIVSFQRETARPLSIAFLVDVSISQERTLPQEKAAARSFIETVIRSNIDQAAIVAFTGPAFVEQGLTRDVLGLYQALERVEVAMPKYLGRGRTLSGMTSRRGMRVPPVEGSSAIWEAISLTNTELLAPASELENLNGRRRAIILFTDGFDTSSRLNMEEAIGSALYAETVIYVIGIGDNKHQGVDKHGLKELALRTGGQAFFPDKEEDLRGAFLEIEKELRSQYLITYSSSNRQRDGSYRRMRIEIANPLVQRERLQLRYRPGYYAKPLPPAKQ